MTKTRSEMRKEEQIVHNKNMKQKEIVSYMRQKTEAEEKKAEGERKTEEKLRAEVNRERSARKAERREKLLKHE